MKITIFKENYDFWWKFQFLTKKNTIFDENFNFLKRNFKSGEILLFLSKMSVFNENYVF